MFNAPYYEPRRKRWIVAEKGSESVANHEFRHEDEALTFYDGQPDERKATPMPSPPDVHLIVSERYAKLIDEALCAHVDFEDAEECVPQWQAEAVDAITGEIRAQLARDTTPTSPKDEGVTPAVRQALGMKEARSSVALDGETVALPSKAEAVADKMAKAAKKAVDDHGS